MSVCHKVGEVVKHFVSGSSLAIALVSSLLVGGGAGVAMGQITLDGDFDHGSLSTWSLANPVTVNFDGRDNFDGGGTWRWIYFRADNVQGLRPTFRIDDDFAFGRSILQNHTMVWSYDNDNWQTFETHFLNSNYEFRNNSAFTQNSVYVAFSIPYSYGQAQAQVNAIKNLPHVQPTLSANSNLVIGQSPGGVDDLGRTVTPKDTWGYKITNPNATGPKKKIALLSGVHAGESLGSVTLDGMVDFLVSDDIRARTLRNLAEFYVYPMMNPDGRFAGYNRSTVSTPNIDPNRNWNPATYDTYLDNKVIGEAMIADTGGDVDYFIDFHSIMRTAPDTDFGYIEFEKGHRQDPFWVNLTQLEPQLAAIDSTSTGWTSANFADWELDAEFDMTFETMFLPNPDEQYYVNLGESFGVAFYQALVPEPTSAVILAGLAGLLGMRRRA